MLEYVRNLIPKGMNEQFIYNLETVRIFPRSDSEFKNSVVVGV